MITVLTCKTATIKLTHFPLSQDPVDSKIFLKTNMAILRHVLLNIIAIDIINMSLSVCIMFEKLCLSDESLLKPIITQFAEAYLH